MNRFKSGFLLPMMDYAIIAIVVLLVLTIPSTRPLDHDKVIFNPDVILQSAAPLPGNWGTTCCLAPISNRGIVYGDHIVKTKTSSESQYYRYVLPAGRYTATCTCTNIEQAGNFKATITYGGDCSPTSSPWKVGQLNGGEGYTFDVPAGVTISVGCWLVGSELQGDYTFVIN